MSVKGVKDSLDTKTVLEKTGRETQYWFGLLDEFGTEAQGHPLAVKFLRKEHGVSHWWAQQIVVHYEQERGIRKPGQRSGGSYALSVSRTLSITPEEGLRLIGSEEGWNRWWTRGASVDWREGGSFGTGDGDVGTVVRPPSLQPANSYGLVAKTVLSWERPDHGKPSKVEMQLLDKGKGKIAINVTHEKIESEELMGDLKKGWTAALDKLKSLFP